MIGKSPMVIAVNNSVPAKSLAELIALDRKEPGKLAAGQRRHQDFGGMMSQLLQRRHRHALAAGALQRRRARAAGHRRRPHAGRAGELGGR